MIYKKIKIVLIALLTIISGSNIFAQNTDSLNHYLRIAAENNPGLRADFLAYKASMEKVPQAAAYQDPELEIGFYIEPMDIVGGRQVADFKLMQMFPWFGTRKAAKNEAMHMAKMAFEQFRETRDNLFLEVYTQWYLLCSLQQQLINNQENKKLLEQLEQLSIRKFSSPSSGNSSSSLSYTPPAPTTQGASSNTASSMAGMGGMSNMGGTTPSANQSNMSSSSGSMGNMSSMNSSSAGMSDVLRIQLEIMELDNSIESLTSEINAEKAKFNALLNRDVNMEVNIPNTFEQTVFLLDETSAITTVSNQNPMLGMITEEGNAYKAKAEMDKKMSYPMFGIGVQYMLNKKTNDPMFAMGDMNGKDMIMPMVSVSIPIYRNKYKAQQRESKLWREASEEKYTNTLNALRSELYKTKHQLDDASRKIVLYKKQADLAQTTYNLILQEFATGKNDLTNVIQVQRQLLDYKLKEAQAIANYNTMVAGIQKLLSFKQTEDEYK